MPYCTNCGTKLDDRANFCPNCGTAVSKKWQNPQSQHTPPSPEPFMDKTSPIPPPEPSFESPKDAVRKGIVNAKFNEKMVGVVTVEITIIAIVVGLASKSLLFGLITFFGLVVLLALPNFGKAFSYILGIVWGVIGYLIASFFFGSTAGWLIGFVAAFCGLSANLAVHQMGRDLDSN